MTLRTWQVALVLSVSCLAVVGCGDDLDVRYGSTKGKSVNGTGVLADMFEQAGHTVFAWGRLSPRLHDRADCIVWFPDDFAPPSEEVRRWFEDWLKERPNRTLIYVCRDFDAETSYWQTVFPLAPEDQQNEIKKRQRNARADFRITRKGGNVKQTFWLPPSSIPTLEDCDWFTLDGTYTPRLVDTLEGTPRWTEGIDVDKLEIELISRIEPLPYSRVLLESEGDALVSVDLWYSSKTIVVANGSFLLNLPLVNHEHRKLAGRLIDEIGPPKQTVVFLESNADGPRIYPEEPRTTTPTGMEIFHLWPTNWILLQLSVVGILLCFWKWPIFGRPREFQTVAVSDFGQHLQALAELFARSENTDYAKMRLSHYRQMVRPTKERYPIRP